MWRVRGAKASTSETAGKEVSTGQSQFSIEAWNWGYIRDTRASLVAQLVKNLPAMQETLVRFLGGEDPLEKGQATHFSILGLPWWLSW